MKCYPNKPEDVSTLYAAASDLVFCSDGGKLDPKTMREHANALRELAQRLNITDPVRIV